MTTRQPGHFWNGRRIGLPAPTVEEVFLADPSANEDDEVYCECGALLADHPPLTKPKPLASWKATRETERAQSKASSRLRW